MVFGINYFTANHFQLAIKPLFNGNISETFWQTGSDVNVRKYGYKYDALHRLQNAIYQKPNEVVEIYNSYNENLWYDKNGNITRLERNGEVDDPINKYTIDNLTYIYDSVNKNRLSIVDDATNITHGFTDDDTNPNPAFIDSTVDYGYDLYGNMTSDTNKGITQILYNNLNLPIKITLPNGIIEYLYNAAGVKVQKKITIGTTIYTTDYQSGFQYLNAQLQFFPHAEGYVNVVNGDRFNYVYNYTDHLGNIRVSYGLDPESNVLKILEENHYYPFGMKHKNYGVDMRTYKENNLGQIRLPLVSEVSYKYKYNSKELQDELGLNWYDYQARNYDPALGRWMNIDPKAETSRRFSPYTYALNNPIYFIDPDGMQATPGDWIPDENGNLVAEKGDNTATLAKFLDREVSDVAKNFKKGKESIGKDHKFEEGEKVVLHNNMTDSIENSNQTDSYNVETDCYNCHGAAMSAVKGEEINPATAGFKDLADPFSSEVKELKSNLKEIPSATEAVFGKTILSFGDHSAVFYGTDNNGTEYYYSKNGATEKPGIFTLDQLKSIYPSNPNPKLLNYETKKK